MIFNGACDWLFTYVGAHVQVFASNICSFDAAISAILLIDEMFLIFLIVIPYLSTINMGMEWYTVVNYLLTSHIPTIFFIFASLNTSIFRYYICSPDRALGAPELTDSI